MPEKSGYWLTWPWRRVWKVVQKPVGGTCIRSQLQAFTWLLSSKKPGMKNEFRDTFRSRRKVRAWARARVLPGPSRKWKDSGSIRNLARS